LIGVWCTSRARAGCAVVTGAGFAIVAAGSWRLPPSRHIVDAGSADSILDLFRPITGSVPMFRRITTTLATLVACLAVAPQALASGRSSHDNAAGSKSGSVFFSSAVYQASENVGQFVVTIQRSNPNGSEIVYYGVTNKGSEAGTNFDKIPNSEADFAPGQSTFTFKVTIHDQGINGPMRYARAYLYGAHPQPLGSPSQAIIELLQNDPLGIKDPQNPLGYTQVPTDGDPLQFVNWYVFGNRSPAGIAMAKVSSSNPAWAQALHTIAYSPGSGTYRFWMWNQPASTLAATVEKYLSDAQVAQPNTTMALSTYSLIHGYCESPSAIKNRYEGWITQLAHGIGNFRVVLYLEEDSLIEMHCLSNAERTVRLQELAYAVKALSADPHLLIYLDAGAPDAYLTAAQTAHYLNRADIAQAQGFFVNATHNDWTTTDVHFGQQIAAMTGGKHFIVQTDDNGRGPLVPPDRKKNGNEDLCNPPGRGTGPLTWDTGYKFVDGFLWFNNAGNSDGPCGAGDPPVSAFWPAYAVGLVQRGTNQVTGPHFNLVKSSTDM
jgi:endoglucanase